MHCEGLCDSIPKGLKVHQYCSGVQAQQQWCNQAPNLQPMQQECLKPRRVNLSSLHQTNVLLEQNQK